MLNRKSFQYRILFLTGGIIAVLAVVFAIILHSALQASKENILSELGDMSGGTSDMVSALFYERYGDVQAFAVNPVFQGGSNEEKVGMLNTYAALYGIYDLILVTDAGGKIVAVNSKDPAGKEINSKAFIGRSVADQEWFKAAREERYTADQAKGFNGTYFEDVSRDSFASEVFGGDRFGTSFSAPIKDAKGKVVGVVSNRAGSRWYGDVLLNAAAVLKESGFGNMHLLMLNKEGMLLGEVKPTADGKFEYLNDPTRVGKYSLISAKMPAVLELKRTGKNGSTEGEAPGSEGNQVMGFAPMNGAKFIDGIGWGLAIYGPEGEVLAQEESLKHHSYLGLAVLCAVICAGAVFFARKESVRLREISAALSQECTEVKAMAGTMASTSGALSASTSEQAAALQETVAAIDEVSAMTQKNADNAKRSNEVAQESSQTAEQGKLAVENMNHSIEEIQKSNAEIMLQVDSSNQKLGDIVKLIMEISNKTKVINDIVFQTKLLSFNASVEAARAGEHGKGFAVVAEEVGNLAQMSGNAAKEITQLLDSSVQQVESTVKETSQEIQASMASSKAKLAEGAKTALECGAILNEVVNKASEVSRLVSEIASASEEQARGAVEINKAMNQLDQVTQANSSSAEEASGISDQLRGQSDRLQKAVNVLNQIVDGGVAVVSEAPGQKVAVARVGKEKIPKAEEFSKAA